jgi:hypothetical protein
MHREGLHRWVDLSVTQADCRNDVVLGVLLDLAHGGCWGFVVVLDLGDGVFEGCAWVSFSEGGEVEDGLFEGGPSSVLATGWAEVFLFFVEAPAGGAWAFGRGEGFSDGAALGYLEEADAFPGEDVFGEACHVGLAAEGDGDGDALGVGEPAVGLVEDLEVDAAFDFDGPDGLVFAGDDVASVADELDLLEDFPALGFQPVDDGLGDVGFGVMPMIAMRSVW